MALLHQEDGADAVVEAIAEDASISVVNLAEVLSKLADAGSDPGQVMGALREAQRDADVEVRLIR